MSERPVGYLSETVSVARPSICEPPAAFEYEHGVEQCYYCGEPASTVDHVVPQSMLQALSTLGDAEVNAVLVRFNRRLTVPSCFECNVVLSNSYQDTLAKRKEELKRRLRRRYQRLLRTPDWSDRELSQLGDRLQQHVIASVVKRDIVLRRLRY